MGVTQLRKFIIPSSSSSRPDTWTTISPSSLGWWPWLGQKIGLLVVRGTDINKWREKNGEGNLLVGLFTIFIHRSGSFSYFFAGTK